MAERDAPVQPQPGNDGAVQDSEQPKPATVLMVDRLATLETGNGQTADHAAGSGNAQEVKAVLADFQFLWRLRKYLLLLAVLAVSVTYNAGLSPPGGFQMDNSLHYNAVAGDPLLPITFFRRYEAFFYCNATAFAASLVLIILLLSRGVASKHVWLRSMQVTMMLDLFSLMGAYAAGSCRTIRSSVFILVLVCAVFMYVGIHILVFIRVVPSWLKERVRKFLELIVGRRNNRNQQEQIKDARKFILMLATFAATITYQAGMSPPGGFWGANGHGYLPGTFVLRRHNLLRFDIFTCCNATSFVASLVIVILLLSTELSTHGISTGALFVCVVVDLLGLIGAYAAGCSRNVGTSVAVVLIILVVLICVLVLVMFLQSKTATDWIDKVKPIYKKMLSGLSWPSEGQLSLSRDSRLSSAKQDDSRTTRQQDDSQRTRQQDDSQRTCQQDTELDSKQTHQEAEVKGGSSNLKYYTVDTNLVSTADVGSASASDLNSIDEIMPSMSEQAAIENVSSSSTAAVNTKEVHTCNKEVKSTGSQHVAIPMAPYSPSDSGSSVLVILPSLCLVDKNTASGDLRTDDDPMIKKSPEVRVMLPSSHGDNAAPHAQPMSSHHIDAEDCREVTFGINSTNYVQATENQEKNQEGVCQEKSRSYLLLLAILAVSLTYQAGLNPPGGFWTSNATNHSAGDPILEDNYHKRYLAFFYFNATAFAASFVMIIMLLSKKMSNKVIKSRALQTAMITDLLALMGAFVAGSCREKTKTIRISVFIFPVVAYVSLHVLISGLLIPGWKGVKRTWEKSPQTDNKLRDDNEKEQAQPKSARTDENLRDDDEKDLERRRNLLFVLAILAATVTYQAGLNPPGGIWPDGSTDGRPGNPALQDSHPKRYNIFYYSNAISFVSSVAVTILLVNRESCERGIKSYALRVCLVAGLLGLLIAYSAGSCRKLKSVIYLIVIAAAVLVCLAIQILVLSSTQGQLNWLRSWLRKILHIKTDSEGSSDDANKKSKAPMSAHLIDEKNESRRQKYLMLLAVLAASIAYQAGLNPPGGFWPDDTPDGYKAGNPVLKDINARRYMVFFVFNSISFMSSIAVVMLFLSKSVRKKKVPLRALHFIMILDLLALMTAYAVGSCRKFRTSIFVLVVVCCVAVYLLIVIILSSGVAKWLKKRKGNC